MRENYALKQSTNEHQSPIERYGFMDIGYLISNIKKTINNEAGKIQ